MFRYKGINCEIDIDECVNYNNPCLNLGTCYNIYGGYVCACPTGFDGQNCELNLNECISNPCHNGGQCLDDVGSYRCNCTGTGFGGEHCELLPRSSPSESNGVMLGCEHINCPGASICVRDIHGPQCVCKSGFIGVPPNCSFNYCASEPCAHGGTCTNFKDRYECTCPPEWKGK